MSDTILPLSSSLSPINNLTLYNKITPIVLMSLGSLYISILIFRYLKWRYRKRKAKKIRMDRQKLERFWKKQSLRLDIEQLQKPLPSYLATATEKQQSHLPQSFESTATLVVSGDHRATGSSESQRPTYPTYKEEKEDVYEKKGENHYDSHGNKKKRRVEWVDKLTNRMDGNHQKKKRRQMLWQWSVAMGYCRYNHGYQLNTILNRLLENKDNSSHCHSNSSSNSSGHSSHDNDL